MFNEYALEFADRSMAKLFEFQIIEDAPNYKTFIASLVFDSQEETPSAVARGLPSGRRRRHAHTNWLAATELDRVRQQVEHDLSHAPRI